MTARANLSTKESSASSTIRASSAPERLYSLTPVVSSFLRSADLMQQPAPLDRDVATTA